jgi:hypothetical protein
VVEDRVKALVGNKGLSIASKLEPDMIRLGHFYIRHPRWAVLVSRTAIMQSFFFVFFFIWEKEPASRLEEMNHILMKVQPTAVLLSPTQRRIFLKASVADSDTFTTQFWANFLHYAKEDPEILSLLDS